jgi:hypothetical protein
MEGAGFFVLRGNSDRGTGAEREKGPRRGRRRALWPQGRQHSTVGLSCSTPPVHLHLLPDQHPLWSSKGP